MLRSLWKPVKTGQLLHALSQMPCLAELLRAQPCLPCRLHRPWLATGLAHRQALEAIIYHYQTVNQRLPLRVMQRYLSPEGFTLATCEGKNNRRYQLVLMADQDLDKEGEATLVLYDEEHITLAQLTFTLCHYHHRTTLFIGGLQGAKARVPHSVIQQATKHCYGLFPKRILLEATRLLASYLDVEQILAVSNKTHIYRSLRYRHSKQKKMYANYDAFWQESGGIITPEGHFMLPLNAVQHSPEEIESKKRAEYRRRYAFLDTLRHDIATQLQQAHSSQPVPAT